MVACSGFSLATTLCPVCRPSQQGRKEIFPSAHCQSAFLAPNASAFLTIHSARRVSRRMLRIPMSPHGKRKYVRVVPTPPPPPPGGPGVRTWVEPRFEPPPPTLLLHLQHTGSRSPSLDLFMMFGFARACSTWQPAVRRRSV